MGLLLDVWENVPGVAVIDHHPPVKGSVISELSQLPWQRLVHGLCYLLNQDVDCPLLGDHKEKIAISWEWGNRRITHVVNLSLFLLCGDMDTEGIFVYNSVIY